MTEFRAAAGSGSTARCSKCRGETVAVTIDGGAGEAIPLFILGQSVKKERLVQVVRQPLRGELCLNCGAIVAQTSLPREDTRAFRERYYGQEHVDPAQTRTLVKRPETEK